MKFAIPIAALLAASSAVAQAEAITVYSSGVDDLGVVKANNATETHWQFAYPEAVLASTPRVATSANGYPIGPWLSDNTTSAWIGPVTSDLSGPVGTYSYFTTFSLGGLDPSSAVLAGRWASDDAGWRILLNGNVVDATGTGGFNTWKSFSIANGFVAGENMLMFQLGNSGGPTGFRVEISGTADAIGNVPEPSAWALMIVGMGAAGAAMRRRRSVVRYA